MHELALLRGVVRLVEDRLRAEPGARPVVVRLRVSALSHVARAHGGDLALLFAAAAEGTALADARLEISRVPVGATCGACDARWQLEAWPLACPGCGAPALTVADVPDVVVQELVVQGPEV